MREEKLRRFPHPYMEFVKFPDGCELQSNRKMLEALRVHFRDHFVRCPDLPVQEFRSNLADFPCLREAEADGSVGLVTEREVCDGL